jgi:hypothetical protein
LNLTPVASSLDERHTVAILKRDVALVVDALAALHAKHSAAKKPKNELETIHDLHTFFVNVYKSKGVM